MPSYDLFDPQNKRKINGLLYPKSQDAFPLTGLKGDKLPTCNPYMMEPCIIQPGNGVSRLEWVHGNHGMRPVQTTSTSCVTAECGEMGANIDWSAPISRATEQQMIKNLESDILSGALLLIPVGRVIDGAIWVIRPLGNSSRAFWVGRIPNEAGYLAGQLGFHVLEQTALGRLSVVVDHLVFSSWLSRFIWADKLVFSEAFRLKFWSLVSSFYAKGTKGEALVFFNASTGTSTGNIFIGTELPILISKGIPREYWAVWLSKGLQGR